MAYAGLTSHHVNYLIWRYLQESGHGEAAVMLQRAWNPDPQNLPFAPYIKTHALVTLVQKGLQYHELEQSLDQAGNPVPSDSIPSFFGPKVVEESSQEEGKGKARTDEAARAASSPTSVVPKPSVDGIVNGSSTKPSISPAPGKAPKGDIGENGVATTVSDETPMEVEQRETPARASATAASPAPSEAVVDADGDTSMQEQQAQEAPAPVFTLTNGQSVGIQIFPTKSADLSPNTTLVDVAGVDHVTRTLWRPNDPTLVAAAGDTFCALWKISGQRPPAREPLVDGSCISALAWDAAGSLLALAAYNDMVGTITLYGQHGSAVGLLPDLPRMVTGIHWAPRSLRMVVVASDGEQSEVTIWDQTVRPDDFPPPKVIAGQVYDVSWSGENEVYASGDGSIHKFHADGDLHPAAKYTSEDDQEPWTFVRTTTNSKTTTVVAASSSTANIWVPSHDISVKAAHHGDITAMNLRPQSSTPITGKNSPIILATSSLDDTVKVWSIDIESKQIHCIHRLFLGPSCPALISAFSPDGYAVAAASHDKLFIWNVERGGLPMATWDVPSAKNGDDEDQSMNLDDAQSSTFERALAWDNDGKKLSLGIGKRMAIVNLQR